MLTLEEPQPVSSDRSLTTLHPALCTELHSFPSYSPATFFFLTLFLPRHGTIDARLQPSALPKNSGAAVGTIEVANSGTVIGGVTIGAAALALLHQDTKDSNSNANISTNDVIHALLFQDSDSNGNTNVDGVQHHQDTRGAIVIINITNAPSDISLDRRHGFL